MRATHAGVRHFPRRLRTTAPWRVVTPAPPSTTPDDPTDEVPLEAWLAFCRDDSERPARAVETFVDLPATSPVIHAHRAAGR